MSDDSRGNMEESEKRGPQSDSNLRSVTSLPHHWFDCVWRVDALLDIKEHVGLRRRSRLNG